MSDPLFHVVEDAFVILTCKGVYRQAPMYQRGEALYARWGSGFVRLLGSGTTVPNVNIDTIMAPPGMEIGKGIMSAPKLIPATHQIENTNADT